MMTTPTAPTAHPEPEAPPSRYKADTTADTTLPMRSSRRKWLAAAGALAIVLAMWFGYFGRPDRVAYLTAKVDHGNIESAVTATGSCNAVVTVQVGSQVSGNIIALFADFNTKVKQGQLVAQIDPALFQAAVDQAKATHDAAKAGLLTAGASLKKAQSDLAAGLANVASQKANVVRARSAVELARIENARRKILVGQHATSQEDADTAQANYDQAAAGVDAAQAAQTAAEAAAESAKMQCDVAQRQLEQAEAMVDQDTATLKSAQLNLDHTRVVAPVEGTVVSRNMDVGQTVAASFQAPTIFLIAQDLTKMQVDTNVDEADVGPVRVGQRADFTVDAYPGDIFTGVVAQVRQAPINVQNVITYDVVVNVANLEFKLFPGMTANVKILTGRASNVLRIPSAALRFRISGERSKSAGQAKTTTAGQRTQTIDVLDHGEAKPVVVKLGMTDGNNHEVLSGLSEGHEAIVGVRLKAAFFGLPHTRHRRPARLLSAGEQWRANSSASKG